MKFFDQLGYSFPQITGMRFEEVPDMPHLRGWTPLGMWIREMYWGRDGLHQTMAEVTKLALQHERGVGYFYEGATAYVVLTKGEDIKRIMDTPYVGRADVHPHFKTGMGNAIFFTAPNTQGQFETGPSRGVRKQLWISEARDPEKRASYVSNMEAHADAKVELLKDLHKKDDADQTPVKLETLLTQHALDVLGDNLMGIKNLKSVLDRWHQLSKPLFSTTTNERIPFWDKIQDIYNHTTPEELNAALSEFVQKSLIDQIPNVQEEKQKAVKGNLLKAIMEQHKREATELATKQAQDNVKAIYASKLENDEDYLMSPEIQLEINKERDRILKANEAVTHAGILADAGFLLFSGHDTTAQTLTTFVKLLAAHPEVVAKLRKIIFNNCYDPLTGTLDLSFAKINEDGPGGGEMGMNTTKSRPDSMFYLHAVMDEVMRLYPAFPFLERVVTRDIELPDPNGKGQVIKLKKGDRILIDTLSLQRTPDLYRTPAQPENDPDKLEGDERDLNKFIPYRGNMDYRFGSLLLVFGLGPTMCPGFLFAIQEMKILMARLVMNFDFNVVGDNSFDYTLNDFILQFKKPTYVNFVPRDVVQELAQEREQQHHNQSVNDEVSEDEEQRSFSMN